MGGNELINTKNRAIESKDKNDIWEMDLIWRIKGSDGRDQYIFTAITYFTKCVKTRVVPNKSEKEINRCIKELIIDKYGPPNRMLTDNCCEFTDKGIKILTTHYNIKQIHCSPRHHKTVGNIERTNGSIWSKLRKLAEFGKNPWVKFVGKATYALTYLETEV
jgi:transposase-like protein